MASQDNDRKTTPIYDSDEEPFPKRTKVLPHWRLDPAVSLSDWSIEIVTTNKETGQEGHKKIYHVHKQNLAVGMRSSEYFATLFRDGGRFAESSKARSSIHLDPIAAPHFDSLLDYIYTGELTFIAENATALYSMAKYFDMRLLRYEAKRFWRNDLEKNGPLVCTLYYDHSVALKEDKLTEAAIDACTKHVMKLQPSVCRRLGHEHGLTLCLEMLNKRPDSVETETFSRQMSLLVGTFLRRQIKNIDVAKFHQLTAVEKLPHIHPKIAFVLVDVERRKKKRDKDYSKSLSNLQKRCIKALVENIHEVAWLQRQGVLLKKQSSSFLAELLMETAKEGQAAQKSLALQLAAARKQLESDTHSDTDDDY